MAAASGLVLMLLAVWGVKGYQDRLERETHAPERLLQRLMAVAAGEDDLQAGDLEETGLRSQEHARILQLLERDLLLTSHPEPGQAVALLTPGAVSMVDSTPGLLSALARRLQALPEEQWQRTVVASDHWEISVGDICLTLRNRDATGAYWRWTSITHCETG